MINDLLARATNGAPQPEVGMGATLLMWSDRHAYTIVEVIRFKSGARAGEVKAVVVQRDEAVRVDNRGMSDAQNYVFLPNPNGSTRTFTIRKNGRFSDGTNTLAIGYRDEHFDFSF